MEKYTPPPYKPPEPVIRRRCHRCNGLGRETCSICRGSGIVATGRDMRGKTLFQMCSGCFGNKLKRCVVCGGDGFIT